MKASRNEAIGNIVQAARWLALSPLTHRGYPEGSFYVVEVVASSIDGLRPWGGAFGESQGVCFGSKWVYEVWGDHYDHELYALDLDVVDFDDPLTEHDSIPTTYDSTVEDDLRLGRSGNWRVDRRALAEFGDEQLNRMARNVEFAMRSYNFAPDGRDLAQRRAPVGKWLVSHGVHAGKLVSRDAAEPTIHDSEAEARAHFAEEKARCAALGYSTWFAYMYDDRGNKHVIDAPAPYC